MMKNKRSKGFTLVEVSASVTLLVLAMGMAITGYVFTMKNVNEADIQNDLDIDIQLAMESMKKDLRLSSLDDIFYYPAGGGPYQALSFPMAYDSDGDGIMERDDDRKIIWDETVIYHIRPGDPDKLVKTVFKPRDNSLTDAQRQAQLDAVVKNGDGSNTYNGRNATSHILFANLLDWKIRPKAGNFDAYATTLSRDRANLGFMLLDPGKHEITFKVIGKNPQSSGYHVGIDQLVVSGSASPREAEAQLPATSQSGATAVNQYVAAGSWKGNRQLYFPATGVGNSFTLSMENDRWEETNFTGLGYEAKDTRVEFLETLSPSDYAVLLDGMDDTWDAEAQTGSEPIDSPPGLMQNWVVRVMQKGSELADNGNWFNYNGRQCRLKFKAAKTGSLKVTNVFIGETTSITNATMDFDTATVTEVTFGGSAGSPIAAAGEFIESDWIDFKIDKDKNYLVSYRVANNSSLCHPAVWKDVRSSMATTCLVVTNGSVATAKDATWSDRTGIEPMAMQGIIGLSTIEASYPVEGAYTSQIFDTHLESPVYRDLSWNADIPTGTALAFKVRTGSQPDLSDAPEWDTVAPSLQILASNKRYVQFQALMQSSPDGQASPILKDVTIDWDGEMQLVDIGGIFTKGPNYGMFEISIDGEPLRSALIVDLEIYKDAFMTKGKERRVTSALKVDLTPRNTGVGTEN